MDPEFWEYRKAIITNMIVYTNDIDVIKLAVGYTSSDNICEETSGPRIIRFTLNKL